MKLWVIGLFAKRGHYSRTNSQHHWQESFNGDSFASQSRYDAYAAAGCSVHYNRRIGATNLITIFNNNMYSYLSLDCFYTLEAWVSYIHGALYVCLRIDAPINNCFEMLLS